MIAPQSGQRISATLFDTEESLESGRRENSVSSHASQVESPQFMAFGGMFLRIGNNGTNTKLSYSLDGVNLTTLIDEAKNAFFTTGPDQVGIFLF